MNRSLFIYFILLFIFNSCKNVNKDAIDILTGDSVYLWDIITKDSIKLKDSLHYYEYTKSISFDVNGQSNRYDILVNRNRRIQIIGPKVNATGLCNKWEILNDSTIKLNCRDVFVVKVISRDTVHLIDTLGVKQHEMYRVHPPWNIDEESVSFWKEQIKSGKYLDKRIY